MKVIPKEKVKLAQHFFATVAIFDGIPFIFDISTVKCIFKAIFGTDYEISVYPQITVNSVSCIIYMHMLNLAESARVWLEG